MRLVLAGLMLLTSSIVFAETAFNIDQEILNCEKDNTQDFGGAFLSAFSSALNNSGVPEQQYTPLSTCITSVFTKSIRYKAEDKFKKKWRKNIFKSVSRRAILQATKSKNY